MGRTVVYARKIISHKDGVAFVIDRNLSEVFDEVCLVLSLDSHGGPRRLRSAQVDFVKKDGA